MTAVADWRRHGVIMEDSFAIPPCYRSEAFAEDLLEDGGYGAAPRGASADDVREPDSTKPSLE
jgi:hypothetical protein